MAEEFSKEEIDAINNDIIKAKSSLISEEAKKEIENAKVQARVEAEKEFQINQKIKEQEALIEQLKQEKLNKEKEFHDKFETMESRINDMIGSKAPVNVENPFKQNNQSNQPIDPMNLTEAQVSEVERASAEAFFGDSFIYEEH